MTFTERIVMTLTAQMAARRDPMHRCHFRLMLVRKAISERGVADPWQPAPQAFYRCVCGCVAGLVPHRSLQPHERVFV